MRHTVPEGCARAATGQAAEASPIGVMDSRRRMPSPEDQNAAVYLSKPDVWKALETSSEISLVAANVRFGSIRVALTWPQGLTVFPQEGTS